MADRTNLRALADRLGVLETYTDIAGVERPTSDASRQALLSAMGHEAGSEEAAAAALAELEREEAARLLPPTVFGKHREGKACAVTLRLPRGTPAQPWSAVLRTEDGAVHEIPGKGRPSGAGELKLALPEEVGPGYHHLALRLGDREASAPLVVVPTSCWTVEDALGGEAPRAYGLWANLYTVRSGSDWGVGDFGDLARLAHWAGTEGADFLGVNPLHALRNRSTDVSPYSPVSRLFRNVIYLDVAAVPEWDEAHDARRLAESGAFGQALARARSAERVDYEAILALKRPVLEILHGVFIARHRDAGTDRGRAYAEFLERQGRELVDFATFAAIQEFMGFHLGSSYWREWPEDLRHPRAPAVENFREGHRDWVDLHMWLQFELDRQLALAQSSARAAGMRIGLYQDLAVGTSASGSDVWAFEGLFRTGATVGAPPDEFAPEGQDWGLPPMDPNRLRADGYRYWIRLVRSAFEHAGALRIDHAMGLRRLFWVPQGEGAAAGAYVRYPEEELLGILALESRRAQAIVVAEDLGTVPRTFPALLGSWGILSSKLLFFERLKNGAYKAPGAYSPRALVTTTTHDHAPLAAWWEGRDLVVRREIGLFDDGALEHERARRERDRRALVARLQGDRLLPKDAPDPDYPTVLEGTYRMLARTPSPLLGVALDDLSAETEPVNVPGVGPERYPSWSRRMHRTLEELADDEGVRRTLAAARQRDGQ